MAEMEAETKVTKVEKVDPRDAGGEIAGDAPDRLSGASPSLSLGDGGRDGVGAVRPPTAIFHSKRAANALATARK